MIGLEKLLERGKPKLITQHLTNLYQLNQVLQKGAFHIVILWSDGEKLMTDVWLFLQLESEDTGYTVDCQTFSGQELITGEGITASDGLIMLGREAELSEKMRKEHKSVSDYVLGQRPTLPVELNPIEAF